MVSGGGIAYRKGYKYQLAANYSIQTDLRVEADMRVPRACHLSPGGLLTIYNGYAWGGPSGPALDTVTFLRGSLVHDCLYQLVRLGKLPESAKAVADDLLYAIIKADGMWSVRARWVYWAKRFMRPATRPSGERLILRAP